MTKIYSPTSSSPNSARQLTSPSIPKMKTPTRNRGLHNRLKHSEPTAGFYTNQSISDNSSTEYLETSGFPHRQRKRKANKSAYCEELASCKKENGRLKVKLLRMEGSHSKKPKEDYCLMSSRDMAEKLFKQREFLEKQFRLKLMRKKNNMKQKIMKELEMSREVISEGTKNKVKEIEEFYHNEIILVEKEHEAKLKIKVNQIKAEYERNLARAQEENLALKRQNDVLKKQLEDTLARAEVKNSRAETTFFNSFESEKEVKEITQKYSELQRDYLLYLNNILRCRRT